MQANGLIGTARLEKLTTGRHDVGAGKTVLVRKALAMAQPNGALVDYATQHNLAEAMQDEHSLASIRARAPSTGAWLAA